MNYRTITLPSFALLIATMGAFASGYSDMFSIPANIKVRYLGQPAGQYQCVDTGFVCNDMPIYTCKVTVADLTNTAAFVRASSSCPTPNLFHSPNAGVVGSYDDDDENLIIIEVVNN